jgi:RNA polymerase sigma-70 factor (ECF subfamily)
MSGFNEYIEELFTEFTEQHVAGEVPEPAEFARRAGAGEPRLRELIATYLSETSPVPPTATAGRRLAECFAPSSSPPSSAELVEHVNDAFTDFAWLGFARRHLETWLVASIEARHEILDHISADLPTLDLSVKAVHGREREQERSCVFQLDHHAGAQVEVRNDRVLLLTVSDLPTQFVGSRPLIALPRAALANTPQLSWAGREYGLPDGIALAECGVREQRDLQVVLGELASENRGSFGSLLAEIRVIGGALSPLRPLEHFPVPSKAALARWGQGIAGDARSGNQGTVAGDSRALQHALLRARSGDPEGLSHLYVRYSDQVLRYVSSFIGDPREAEDITQNVFAKLMTTIKRYEQHEIPFDAWILRVSRNAALDHLRAQRSNSSDEARRVGTGRALAGSEEALRRALEELPEDQREVLVLRHIVGLSPVEIAGTLDKTENSVHILHHRGRRTLRESLLSLGLLREAALSQQEDGWKSCLSGIRLGG